MNELGVETLDADDVVHELLPDPEERRRIAAEVFSDPEKRRALEAKIHPIVKARIDEWLSRVARHASCGMPPTPNSQLLTPNFQIRVAIIPLLFEAHWEKNFDIICCVVSSREKQIERMMTTRGMTRAEAEARLAAQMPVEEKAKRSHYVIHNDGTAEELKVQAAAFLKFVMQKQMQPKLPND